MKDYYLWFLSLFILITACIVSYKYGYADGVRRAAADKSLAYPHDPNAYDRPDKVLYHRQEEK